MLIARIRAAILLSASVICPLATLISASIVVILSVSSFGVLLLIVSRKVNNLSFMFSKSVSKSAFSFWISDIEFSGDVPDIFDFPKDDDDDDDEDDEDDDDDEIDDSNYMSEDNLTLQGGNSNSNSNLMMANKFGYIDDDGNVIYVDINLDSDENEEELKLWYFTLL
jgi:hypothetical protein